MENIWKSLKKTMDGVLKKAGEITKEAADKAEEMTKLGKIKLEIFQVRKDIEKKQTELGKLIYDKIAGTGKKRIEVSEDIAAIITEISELESELEEKEKEYNKVKSEDDNIKGEEKTEKS